MHFYALALPDVLGSPHPGHILDYAGGAGLPLQIPENRKRPPPPGEGAMAKLAIDFCRVFCRLKRSRINGLRVFSTAMAKVFSMNFPTTYFLWRVIYMHILLPLYYL